MNTQERQQLLRKISEFEFYQIETSALRDLIAQANGNVQEYLANALALAAHGTDENRAVAAESMIDLARQTLQILSVIGKMTESETVLNQLHAFRSAIEQDIGRLP